MDTRLRGALLISGGATTGGSIITASKEGGELAGLFNPVLVISSDPKAKGIRRCLRLGVPERDVVTINPHDYETSEAWGDALLTACKQRGVDIAGQYGWHPKTPANFIDPYRDRMINQHPAPVPWFGGKGMFGVRPSAARYYFVAETNREWWTCAVSQRVSPDRYDAGALLNYKKVAILHDDDPEKLQRRVLPFEHEVQIATLLLFAQEKVEEIDPFPDLVREDERDLLVRVKRLAIQNFPNG